MIYFYKVLDLEDKPLGIVTSHALRYYNERNNRMLCCLESLAQYICVNDSFYRVNMLNPECEKMKGIYPEAQIIRVSKEEYENFKNAERKEILE